MVVEGDGVVGQFPKLSPGETFSYNSYHVVKTESTASGSFFGTTGHGRPVCTRIPAFEMHPPLMA
jgi:ApaG protein